MRLMGRKHKSKISPAQLDSGNSILEMEEHCHTESAENAKNVIFTMRIKNIMAVLEVNGGTVQ